MIEKPIATDHVFVSSLEQSSFWKTLSKVPPSFNHSELFPSPKISKILLWSPILLMQSVSSAHINPPPPLSACSFTQK